MEKYFEILKKVPLFKDIEADNLNNMLGCLGGFYASYKKNQIIFSTGEKVFNVGIIILGKLHIVKEDYLGNKTIIAELGSGDIFGEAFVCAKLPEFPVTVVCEAKSEILFIDYNKVVNVCSSACAFHSKLIENMLKIIAIHNIGLNQKIELLSMRTMREKILLYIATINKNNQKTVTIPFSRDGFADYLCVNRSALSKELGKMQSEGILTFDKNKFTLL